MSSFVCGSCGRDFEVRQSVLDRYPGWTPTRCLDCRDGTGSGTRTSGKSRTVTRGADLTIDQVLERFDDGPDSGIFTDGASEGNPGPGGWGAVMVSNGEVVAERHGSEAHTTNNRMELTAMVAGLEMAPVDRPIDVYTDSQLVVNILTQWAEGWERRGWKKKSAGPIANLELVQQAYELFRQRPLVTVRWIRAHSGYRWNEYADALATAYRRSSM